MPRTNIRTPAPSREASGTTGRHSARGARGRVREASADPHTQKWVWQPDQTLGFWPLAERARGLRLGGSAAVADPDEPGACRGWCPESCRPSG